MSQGVTRTNDSLTVIPTRHLSLMVKDLEQGDKCAKRLAVVENSLELCESKNAKLDSMLAISEEKERLYKENIDSFESIVSKKDMQIGMLKKSRRMAIAGGIVLSVLSALIAR